MTWDMLQDSMPELLLAALGTIRMTLFAFVLAAVFGLVVALLRMAKGWVGRIALLYIELVRGTPALTLLFLIYYGLVPLGIVLNSFLAAVVALGLNGAAYLAEVYRAGIQAVDKGQREAAQMVGLQRGQVGDSDDLGVRLLFINKAMRATSGCRIITRGETLGYELTLRRRPMAKPEDGKRRPCPTPLDALVGVQTFGNTSIIQNRMIVLGPKEEFERFLSSVRLSRDSVNNEDVKILSDVFCWGAMTDTGFSVEQPSGAGGTPLVAVARDASLLRQAFSDTPCQRFTKTIVTS